jgi:hypothetical protein
MPHATRRAAQRRIELEAAEAVYTRFDTERPGKKAGTRMLIGTVDGQRIKIVVDDRGPSVILITVADMEVQDED